MILGIDEVGRGPWAGPLVVGGVILSDPTADWCSALADSKQLTAKKRTELAPVILENAAATALGWVSSRELDELGLSAALRLAVRRVVENIQSQHVPFSEIIIDGTVNFLSGTALAPYVTILKKADSLIKEVSAASIIAKVARDEYMCAIAEQYPEYGFEKHVGYGTAIHKTALEKYGPCSEHRRSFRPVPRDKSLGCATTASGHRAESLVASYLSSHGHTILARNHKTRFYEIDIISTKDSTIYFTEVKYRASSSRGGGLAAIDQRKQRQMHFAAEAFLQYQPYLKNSFSPRLAVASVSGLDFHIDTWFPLS